MAQVFEYRAHVDARLSKLLPTLPEPAAREAAPVVELGIQHEQQHQELILTDLKHAFAANPLEPVYRKPDAPPAAPGAPPVPRS